MEQRSKMRRKMRRRRGKMRRIKMKRRRIKMKRRRKIYCPYPMESASESLQTLQ